MKKWWIIGLVVVLILVVFAFIIFNKKENSLVNECVKNSDCIPDSCCHAKSCTSINNEPNCSGAFCTMDCRPGTLDCRQGSCGCVNGKCSVMWNK